MKIYFAASIRGGRDDQPIYQEIINLLKAMGHQVFTEHIGLPEVTDQEADLNEREIYERDMAWLIAADMVVAEVTNPSLGVGYELGKAEQYGKPTLCLYRRGGQKALSAMISGNDYFALAYYDNLTELPLIFSTCLAA